jgi:hypothetical protein
LGLLASSGSDRRAIIWDLSKENTNEEMPYGLVNYLNKLLFFL